MQIVMQFTMIPHHIISEIIKIMLSKSVLILCRKTAAQKKKQKISDKKFWRHHKASANLFKTKSHVSSTE